MSKVERQAAEKAILEELKIVKNTLKQNGWWIY